MATELAPAANTPYRLMMRHLLGGSYGSPGAELDVPRTPDSCAVASPTPQAASGNSHAEDSPLSPDPSPGILSFALDSPPASYTASGSFDVSHRADSYSAASSETRLYPGNSPVAATESVGGSSLAPSPLVLESRPLNPDTGAAGSSECSGNPPHSVSVPVALHLEPGNAISEPAAALSPATTGPPARLPAVRTICDSPCDSTLALSPGSWAGTPIQGEHSLR